MQSQAEFHPSGQLRCSKTSHHLTCIVIRGGRINYQLGNIQDKTLEAMLFT